jgi:hypothetical protein
MPDKINDNMTKLYKPAMVLLGLNKDMNRFIQTVNMIVDDLSVEISLLRDENDKLKQKISELENKK